MDCLSLPVGKGVVRSPHPCCTPQGTEAHQGSWEGAILNSLTPVSQDGGVRLASC